MISHSKPSTCQAGAKPERDSPQSHTVRRDEKDKVNERGQMNENHPLLMHANDKAEDCRNDLEKAMGASDIHPYKPVNCFSPSQSQSSSTALLRKYIAPLVLLISSTFLISFAISMVPTEEEADLADHYGIPILTAARKIRAAQKIADDAYLSELLGQKGQGPFEKVVDAFMREGIEVPEPPENCEATVVILRHCEKGTVREHCLYPGFERSAFLPTLFGDEETDRWPTPSYIYAVAPQRTKATMIFREIETIGPLAKKSNVTVNYKYDAETVNEMTLEILMLLQTGQLCGKIVVVSWRHSGMGHVARHLGCGPLQGCPLDYKGKMFDAAWQVKFLYRQFHHSHRKDLKVPEGTHWGVYGSVQMEGFDPLAFSKKMGDYPPGGTKSGGRWKEVVLDLPEREDMYDNETWARIEEKGLLG